MCQVLEDYIADTTQDSVTRQWAWVYYGSALRSFYTMFEVTLSGCWPNYVRTLVEEVSPAYAVFYVIYVMMVVFAVIRIISAIFLKDTLQAASDDTDMMVSETIRQKAEYVRQLGALFVAADTSGDGLVSEE